MSSGTSLIGLHLIGLQELRKNWGWFLMLGVVLVALGTIALGASVVTTLAGVFFFGWLLIVGGVLEAAHAFWREKGWGGFFIDLLIGLLHVVVGFLLVANPAASALALTLLIAFFLMFGGLFRIAVALAVRFHNWVWLLLHGVVNLLLGLLIWCQWPLSGLWVIGLFIGIDLLLHGWSLLMLGLAARRIPVESAVAASGPA